MSKYSRGKSEKRLLIDAEVDKINEKYSNPNWHKSKAKKKKRKK